tara:strand:- start:393 stop:695 length:303 start_codon:yes stop_codon:yes gene_type:complete
MMSEEEGDQAELEEELMSKIDAYISSLKEDPSLPYFILSGSGPALYYDVGGRTMVCVQRGTEVVPIDKYDGVYKDKKVVFIGKSQFILVNEDELIDIGFN